MAASESANSMRSQTVTASQIKRNSDNTPYAFTEWGVAMLSGVLSSDKAINMNIAIMSIHRNHEDCQSADGFKDSVARNKRKIRRTRYTVKSDYDAMENLLDEKAAQRK